MTFLPCRFPTVVQKAVAVVERGSLPFEALVCPLPFEIPVHLVRRKVPPMGKELIHVFLRRWLMLPGWCLPLVLVQHLR